jgi:predicted unusual protein kinase regulating ubiquinone biosynthesis (AarF/ABC1/UbiB family)
VPQAGHRQGHNAELIAGNFGPRRQINVPRIFWDHTTRRVLVMEFLEGIKITDVDALQAAGVDLQAVSQLVIGAYCEQLFLHGMFHADPHPGNLFVRPGPELVMLDFGLCRNETSSAWATPNRKRDDHANALRWSRRSGPGLPRQTRGG